MENLNLRTKRKKHLELGKVVFAIFRTLLIIILAYVILKPFIFKILYSFFEPSDMLDSTVKYVPRQLSTFYWKYAWDHLHISTAGLNTLRMALISGVIQVITSTVVGYGLARFKFKGKGLLFGLVILTLIVPQQIYSVAQYLYFNRIGLLNNALSVYILSFGCMTVKQGLYVYLMREFFRGMPRDLENAAYVDGASTIGTFIKVMLPNAFTMMITIFLFAFCWQWTDTYFRGLFTPNIDTLTSVIFQTQFTIKEQAVRDHVGTGIAQNTASLIIIAPLVILAIVCQKFLVKSISQSGLAN